MLHRIDGRSGTLQILCIFSVSVGKCDKEEIKRAAKQETEKRVMEVSMRRLEECLIGGESVAPVVGEQSREINQYTSKATEEPYKKCDHECILIPLHL